MAMAIAVVVSGGLSQRGGEFGPRDARVVIVFVARRGGVRSVSVLLAVSAHRVRA